MQQRGILRSTAIYSLCTNDKMVDLPNYIVYTREDYNYHLKCLVLLEYRKKGKPQSWVRGIRDLISSVSE